MPATPRVKQDPEVREAQTHVAGRIREAVMTRLGLPDQLWSVQVRRLWADFYRVNVFVGADSVSTRIAHSYFLTTDENGEILLASPPLTRRYGPLPAGLVPNGA